MPRVMGMHQFLHLQGTGHSVFSQQGGQLSTGDKAALQGWVAHFTLERTDV